MENKRTDDVKFLINTFSITLIIVAILVTFQPYLESETRLDEVKQVEANIITVTPAEVSKMLTSKTARPVMLIGYASWCYYCRQVMPVVVKMIENHELSDVTPVFVSFDTEPRKLSKYLVHNDYNLLVYPYVIDHGLHGSISGAMQTSGSRFTGIIPYIGFFDKNGKVKAESVGIVGEDKLLAMYKKSEE